MKPIEFPEQNMVFAKDQQEYLPLPAHVVREPDGRVITCWELTDDERYQVFRTGRVWLQQMTFGAALQPQLPSVASPFDGSSADSPAAIAAHMLALCEKYDSIGAGHAAQPLREFARRVAALGAMR